MSDLAQHILTWKCSGDESSEIRKAVQACEDKGKFKTVCPAPGGIQFQAKLEVAHPFLLNLSAQYPGTRFSHEWASSSRMDAGLRNYLSGALLSEVSCIPEEHAKEIWARAADNEAAFAFQCKAEENWQGYQRDLLSLPKEDLIEKAAEIAAVRQTRDVLTSPSLGRDDREYLDRFVNPLEVVSDSISAAFDHVLWQLRDRHGAEQDYELEPEYQEHIPEQSM